MSTSAVLVPLLVTFAAVMAVTAWQIRAHHRTGRHRLQMRTRVRVYLGRKYP